MPDRFDYFVVLAEMRTGSNFLESNLNAYPGLSCHGELFNPHFIGFHNRCEFRELGMDDRAADPLQLIERLRAEDGLAGFRFFHDHDPRVLAHCLPDPRCAKIVLTRNPIESYVSLKIARATGQWRLTNVTRQRRAQAEFDAAEFEDHLQQLQAFQVEILRGLQVTGQTAFYIAYEDLNDVEVLNGLARHLGVEARLDAPAGNLKKQNPEPLNEKVINPAEMETALARLDRFNLSRTPNFEPRRGPSVPSFVAGAGKPLLFMPVGGGPDASLRKWMAELDGVATEALHSGFTQRTLTDWLRANPDHCAFTVLRHPLERAYTAFSERILSGQYRGIRESLRRNYGLTLPDADADDGYGPAERRVDFLGFLKFLKANLAGQSGIRVDGAWASQGAILRGFARFLVPDRVLREDELDRELAQLAERFGCAPPSYTGEAPTGLAEIHDASLEAAAQAAYARDYWEFGFAAWEPRRPARA